MNKTTTNKSDSYRALGLGKITAPNLGKEKAPRADVIRTNGDLRGGKK